MQGISWTELTIDGRSAHAGTTPMRLRRDAGYVAAEITTFARRLALELGDAQVATVGRLEVRPDLVNVVPNGATLTVDLRNTDDERAAAGRGRPGRRGRPSGRRRARHGDAVVHWPASSRSTSIPATVALVEATAQRLGHTTRRMPSGAGHDAQMLARICPAAMIFTPSVNGLSHNIAEHTHPADVTAGADVLLQTLLTLTGRRRARRPAGDHDCGRSGPRRRSPRGQRARARDGQQVRWPAGRERRPAAGRWPVGRRSVTVSHASSGRQVSGQDHQRRRLERARPADRVEGVLEVVAAGGDDDAGRPQRVTAVRPRGMACWWSRPWRYRFVDGSATTAMPAAATSLGDLAAGGRAGACRG